MATGVVVQGQEECTLQIYGTGVFSSSILQRSLGVGRLGGVVVAQ